MTVVIYTIVDSRNIRLNCIKVLFLKFHGGQIVAIALGSTQQKVELMWGGLQMATDTS